MREPFLLRLFRDDNLYGIDTSYYGPLELFTFLEPDMILDARNDDQKTPDQLDALIERRVSLVLRDTQFGPLQLAEMAALCRENGTTMHLEDTGEHLPDQMAFIISHGAKVYTTPYIERDIQSKVIMAQASATREGLVYFDLDKEKDDVISLQQLELGGTRVETRMDRPTAELQVIYGSDLATLPQLFRMHPDDKYYGIDSRPYSAADIQTFGKPGMIFDSEFDNNIAPDQMALLGLGGASFVLYDDQFGPIQLAAIAAACLEGGARLHVIDTGYNAPNQLGAVGAAGAFIYSYDGWNRDSLNLMNIASLSRGNGRLVYFDFGVKDPLTLQQLRTSGARLELRANRSTAENQVILSGQSFSYTQDVNAYLKKAA